MTPQNETELAEAIRGATGPLRIRGGGTRPVGRPVAGAVIETSGLGGIVLYEPAALTLVAKAGTPLAEIEARLAAEGQRLPFEPPDWRGLLGTSGVPTIGAVAAGNLSGPGRVQAGACRDSLIGVRFVDGLGNAVKNGGRVMKNVTGYDLVKLMAGAWGTLGVLSEVSFKVLPAAGAAATLSVAVEDAAQAVVALSAALGSPFDVTGAAWLPDRGALVRIEGLGGSVDYRAGRLAAELGRFGAVSVERDPDRIAAVWRGLRDAGPFHGRPGDVWRISVRPSEAPAILGRIEGEVFLDWGGGLIWALVPEGTDLRARIAPFAGHAALIRGSEATRAQIAPFQAEVPAIAALSRALRARFDPRGILNPGLMD